MKKIKAKEFDKKFDNNEDVSDFMDWKRSYSAAAAFGLIVM